MPASGNITEDLDAIRDMTIPGVTLWASPEGTFFPWKPGVSEERLAEAAIQVPGFPEELAELYRVTEQLFAGDFAVFASLDEALAVQDAVPAHIEHLVLNSAGHDMGTGPDGDVFWVWIEGWRSLGVEFGGSTPGRVWGPSFSDLWEWKLLAWSLSDMVACTRELYEAGWFQESSGPYGDRGPFEGEKYREAGEIIDRWHCSPLIAGGNESHHRNPERPPAD